ncbi:hypothetical protein [Saccharibacillus sacchari]|uniref:Uncharacterized protein n=1 Tax=Saccharibacillus sacchari TaxID=456493 RepID=A0ACC6P9A0_9BACL
MSFVHWIASDRPIPEVEPTGYRLATVREMMDLGVPPGDARWEEMDPDSTVLYAPDPKAVNVFSVKKCPSVPKSLQLHTRHRHVYALQVELDFEAALWVYIADLERETHIEIWNLRDGQDSDNVSVHTRYRSRSALNLADLEFPFYDNRCLRIG